MKFPQKKNPMKVLFALTFLIAVGFALNPQLSEAVLMRESSMLDGGGGGGGGTYTQTNVQVPEITPSTTDLVTTEATTNSSGLSAYRYNIQLTKTLWYAWNRWASGCGSTTGCLPSSDSSTQGWVSGLSNPNITVGYDIGVVNPSTGAPYAENANIPTGTQVKLVFGPYVSNNLYWYGTGYSMDSPFGEWRANAAPPPRVSGRVTCDSKDYIVKYDLPGYGLTFDVYIPFVVNPPAKSVSVIPSGLSCGTLTANSDGSSSMLCTVTGTGPIVPRFHFDATYGKFYYRYYDYRTNYVAGCYGNNIPMTDSFGIVTGPSYNTNTSIPAAYQVAIPAADIDFPLNGITSNAPPATPTLTCAASGVTGQALSFSVQGTDPEADTLRYGIDWVNAGTVNEWVPASGYVQSGTSQTVTHTWSAAGTYLVQALSQDAGGGQSAFTSCTVTITAPPAAVSCTATPTTGSTGQSISFASNVSGGSGNYTYSWSDGGTVFGSAATAAKSFSSAGTKTITLTVTDNGLPPTVALSASPTSITNGNSSTLTWSSSNATSCTGTGFTTGGAVSGSVTVSPSTTTNYGLSCTGSGGTNTGSATVTVTPAPTPTASLTASPSSMGAGGAGTVTWSSANTTSCTGTNFSTGGATSGSVLVSPLTTTTYSMTCTGLGGSVTKTDSITIVPAATASLTASPTSITSGGSSTLTWSSTNASSCTGSGFATGSATSGSVAVTPTVDTTYSVTCTGTGGSGSGSATVTVTAAGGGGGGGGGCFAGDTLVTMADGTVRAIDQVRVGDKVLGQGENGVNSAQTVTHVFVHTGGYTVMRINGSLLATPNHPMRVIRDGVASWKPAAAIQVGDELVGTAGTVPVNSIAVDEASVPAVYNLEVEKDHTYFAGGVLVHNKLNNFDSNIN